MFTTRWRYSPVEVQSGGGSVGAHVVPPPAPAGLYLHRTVSPPAPAVLYLHQTVPPPHCTSTELYRHAWAITVPRVWMPTTCAPTAPSPDSTSTRRYLHRIVPPHVCDHIHTQTGGTGIARMWRYNSVEVPSGEGTICWGAGGGTCGGHTQRRDSDRSRVEVQLGGSTIRWR